MHSFLSHRNYTNHLANLAAVTAMNNDAKEAKGSPLRRLIKGWKRRKMMASLESMEDRLLRDIGIQRTDIKRLVYGFDEYELSMVPVTAPRPMTPFSAQPFAA